MARRATERSSVSKNWSFAQAMHVVVCLRVCGRSCGRVFFVFCNSKMLQCVAASNRRTVC